MAQYNLALMPFRVGPNAQFVTSIDYTQTNNDENSRSFKATNSSESAFNNFDSSSNFGNRAESCPHIRAISTNSSKGTSTANYCGHLGGSICIHIK